jgi:hypothetical protein
MTSFDPKQKLLTGPDLVAAQAQDNQAKSQSLEARVNDSLISPEPEAR